MLDKSEYKFITLELANLIDEELIIHFMSATAKEKNAETIEEVLSWLDDYSTSWWGNCFKQVCEETDKEPLFEALENMDWNMLDWFGSIIDDECRAYVLEKGKEEITQKIFK